MSRCSSETRPGTETDIQKEHGNDDIVVTWEPTYCIHTANCLNGLPEVFDVWRRPWIEVDRALRRRDRRRRHALPDRGPAFPAPRRGAAGAGAFGGVGPAVAERPAIRPRKCPDRGPERTRPARGHARRPMSLRRIREQALLRGNPPQDRVQDGTDPLITELRFTLSGFREASAGWESPPSGPEPTKARSGRGRASSRRRVPVVSQRDGLPSSRWWH